MSIAIGHGVSNGSNNSATATLQTRVVYGHGYVNRDVRLVAIVVLDLTQHDHANQLEVALRHARNPRCVRALIFGVVHARDDDIAPTCRDTL